ncbi:RagB/SusD family nutrient uptake outer membrane protein [Pedobacter sp. ASV1-7]|uniref:RagB/SusD family nutrient uptake outer membrane protein n=1 Tax=Pedobacter sp. ASV1-7 TaxID=3145237 RepID=UPI0032E8DB74
MKKIFYILSIFLLSACNKGFLDVVSPDEIVNESFWNNEEQLVLALNTCYNSLRNINLIEEEMQGDNSLYPTSAQRRLVGSGTFATDLGLINSEWVGDYAGIRRCNVFLENYNKASIPQETKDRLAAEARVIRAYLLGHLVSLYGDVPLVTKVLDIDELYEPRNPKEQVVDFILNELQESADLLDAAINTGVKLGRLNKGAALALKARYALYNNRFDVAQKAAKDVMDLGVYALYTNGNPASSYSDLFTYNGKLANGKNRETIIARLNLKDVSMHNLSRLIQVPNENSRWSPTKSLVDAYLCSDGLPINISPLYKENNYNDVFENRDPRMTQTILKPGSAWGGMKDGNPANTNPGIFTAPKFNADGQGCVTLTGYYFNKYVEIPAVATGNRDANDIHIMRYAEVLLTYAEAAAEQGALSQNDLDISINLLRDRVGMKHMEIAELTANGLNVRDEIRRERRIELAIEGQRYFDILRWKQGNLLAEDMKGMKKSWALVSSTVSNKTTDQNGYIIALSGRTFVAPKHYLWPVPFIQYTRNPALGQNTGW